MDYQRLHQTLQQRLQPILPLMPAQLRRLCLLCQVIFMSQRLHLTFLARCLPLPTQQDSRVRWLRRLLGAQFMTAEYIYQPVLRTVLQGLSLSCWHLVIDRTNLVTEQVDLVTISLHYHRRAVPLVWQQVPYGGVDLSTYVDLVKRCAQLLPVGVQVVFHGDAEFGGAQMIRALRDLGWDFILAQRGHVHIWQPQADTSHPLQTLAVPSVGSLALPGVTLFAGARLAGINLLAFLHKRRDKYGHLKHEVCYLATSLPLTRQVRRLGRRRWGIEPFHRDYKSAGWQVDHSRLQSHTLRAGLLAALALCYLLSVCLGRWLCKTGQRARIDTHRHRHLSLFRLGWDMIVHLESCHQSIPFRLRLYS